MEVKAECKVCRGSASADLFKLHHDYKQMVCPACYTGKTKQKEEMQKKTVEVKPPGWDAEDEYLDKISKLKVEEDRSQFSKVAGTNQVRCKCSQCKYDFKYDPLRKRPSSCPYCDAEVPKLKSFSML